MRSVATLAWGVRFGKSDPTPPPTNPLKYENLPPISLHGVLHKSCAGCASVKPVSVMQGELCARCAEEGK